MKKYISELKYTAKIIIDSPIKTHQEMATAKILKNIAKDLVYIRKKQDILKKCILDRLDPLISHEDWLKVRKMINKL